MDDNTCDWLKNVSPSGLFHCSNKLNTTIRGNSYIPSGWNFIDETTIIISDAGYTLVNGMYVIVDSTKTGCERIWKKQYEYYYIVYNGITLKWQIIINDSKASKVNLFYESSSTDSTSPVNLTYECVNQGILPVPNLSWYIK